MAIAEGHRLVGEHRRRRRDLAGRVGAARQVDRDDHRVVRHGAHHGLGRGRQTGPAADAEDAVEHDVRLLRPARRRAGPPALPSEATTSTPAAVTAASPPACGCSDTVTTAAATPSSAQRGDGVQGVAAVVPAADEGDDAAARRARASRTATTAASPRAARSISVPSRQLAPSRRPRRHGRCSRRSASITASPQPSAMTTADAMPASWDRDTCSVVHAQVVGAGLHGAAHLQVRAAVGAAQHRGVGPVQADRRPERLGQRLLGREPGGQGVERRGRAPAR